MILINVVIIVTITLLMLWMLPRDIKKVPERDRDIKFFKLQKAFQNLKEHFKALIPAAKQAGVELGKLKGPLQNLRAEVLAEQREWNRRRED